MPSKLVVKGVEIRKKGFTGISLKYENNVYCVDPGEDVAECTCILCTHMHRRHCTETALQLQRVETISPASRELKYGDVVKVKLVEVEILAAYNKPELYASNPPHPKGLGVGYFLVFPSGLELYYMGDTNLVEEVLDVKRGLTVLVPPIGGGCVMTPEEALEVVKSLRPVITIPVHWEKPELFYKFRDIAQPYTQNIRLS